MASLLIPSSKQNGFDNQAEAEPVRAKTIKIMVNWKLDSIPHRCLKLAMRYKLTAKIRENSFITAVCFDFGNTKNNDTTNNSLRTHNQSN